MFTSIKRNQLARLYTQKNNGERVNEKKRVKEREKGKPIFAQMDSAKQKKRTCDVTASAPNNNKNGKQTHI